MNDIEFYDGSKNSVRNHFPEIGKMVKIGSKTKRKNELLDTTIN